MGRNNCENQLSNKTFKCKNICEKRFSMEKLPERYVTIFPENSKS